MYAKFLVTRIRCYGSANLFEKMVLLVFVERLRASARRKKARFHLKKAESSSARNNFSRLDTVDESETNCLLTRSSTLATDECSAITASSVSSSVSPCRRESMTAIAERPEDDESICVTECTVDEKMNDYGQLRRRIGPSSTSFLSSATGGEYSCGASTVTLTPTERTLRV